VLNFVSLGSRRATETARPFDFAQDRPFGYVHDGPFGYAHDRPQDKAWDSEIYQVNHMESGLSGCVPKAVFVYGAPAPQQW